MASGGASAASESLLVYAILDCLGVSDSFFSSIIVGFEFDLETIGDEDDTGKAFDALTMTESEMEESSLMFLGFDSS
jgi:hypothetical protein